MNVLITAAKIVHLSCMSDWMPKLTRVSLGRLFEDFLSRGLQVCSDVYLALSNTTFVRKAACKKRDSATEKEKKNSFFTIITSPDRGSNLILRRVTAHL